MNFRLYPHLNYRKLRGDLIKDWVFTGGMLCFCEPIRARVFLIKNLTCEHFLPIIFFKLFRYLSGQLQVAEITTDPNFMTNSRIFHQIGM